MRLRPLRTTSLICPLLGLLHVALTPYSKVEESFSTQATHDILVHGFTDLHQYDHVRFPGAVPRSFLGPFVLALVTYPPALIGRALGLIRTSADVQLTMRFMLVLLSTRSLGSFGNALFSPPKLTQREAWIHRACFDIITASQFHFLFWAGRTTPNSIALPFVLHAFKLIAALPSSQPRFLRGIAFLTFLAATLRIELVGFLIPASILFLAGVGSGTPSRIQRLLSLLRAGLTGGVAGAAASILVDTYFWRGPRALLNPRQWLWPELSGILFNVVEGKSSEWGVSPWHAYLTASVPKLLSATSIFLIWTVITRLQPQADRKGKARSMPPINKVLPNMTPIRWLLALCAGHVGLLSLLGHKEWRFIVYAVPCFNAGSALGLRRLLTTRVRQLIAILILGVTIAITALLTLISHANYPGGCALAELERRFGASESNLVNGDIRIHIDVLPAMTGITLFQALRLPRQTSKGGFGVSWLPSAVPEPSSSPGSASLRVEYDKTENISRNSNNLTAVQQWSTYDFLITEREPGCSVFDVVEASSSDEHPTSIPKFEVLFESYAYSGVQVKRPAAYLQSLLYPHGELWQLFSSSASSGSNVGIASPWWRVANAALPIHIKTEALVVVCQQKRADLPSDGESLSVT
ncbi:alpha-1,6- mannosyltransferase [Tilletia horrida]|uniref:Mannosyltransferase n=1 Tax=Tilletia horrida TaxID=155126 RepID=A0AAN6GSM0_9BASI|nr:alpha-1,6- mannosyltransferase [Tilletia horrida]KAK0568027.1 alpha-1,6- mannosyltransferase [Tilletia horrida]